jgi:hypothetical protein
LTIVKRYVDYSQHDVVSWAIQGAPELSRDLLCSPGLSWAILGSPLTSCGKQALSEYAML